MRYITRLYSPEMFVLVLESLGLQESDPAEYFYLNRTGGVYDVSDVDDNEEFHATMVSYITRRNITTHSKSPATK